MFYSNNLALKFNAVPLFHRGARFNWLSRSILILGILLLLALAFYLFLIGVNNSLDYKSINLESKIAILEKKYQKISIELSLIQNPDILENYARTHNLVETKNVSYIKLNQPILAARQ